MIGTQPDGTLTVEKVENNRKISISRMNTMSQCGYKYELRYVYGLKEPVGLALLVGSAVDTAVTLNLDRKMMQGEFMALDVMDQLTTSVYRRLVKEAADGDAGILFKQDELLEGKDASIKEGEAKALRLARLHAQVVAPNLKPIYLQRPVSIKLPDYPFDLGGIIDIQEADSIRDTKTKNKTPPRTVADNDDQLTMYALLVMVNDGGIPPKLILDCLVDNKTPVYKPFETTRTDEDFDVLLRRLEAVHRAIEKGAFVPARESDWWCSGDCCGFHETCKYVKRWRRPAA